MYLRVNSMHLCANWTAYLYACLKCFVQVFDAVCRSLVLIHYLGNFVNNVCNGTHINLIMFKICDHYFAGYT